MLMQVPAGAISSPSRAFSIASRSSSMPRPADSASANHTSGLSLGSAVNLLRRFIADYGFVLKVHDRLVNDSDFIRGEHALDSLALFALLARRTKRLLDVVGSHVCKGSHHAEVALV
jgi:hypothetical protein